MVRAQIYLTREERLALALLAKESGRSQSELIREAIDQFIAGQALGNENKMAAVKAAKGMWGRRDDLPDFAELRGEFDRQPGKRVKHD